jgi:hypothetical protein
MSGVALTVGPAKLTDYFGASPQDDPLSYPGLIPPHSYLLLGPGRLRKLRLADPPAGRHAVLALGSNASPAQLIRKFAVGGVSQVVPVVAASVAGLCVLPSAHLNPAGYVPWSIASAEDSAVSTAVFVTFLDDAQLTRMDETEPNYVRVVLAASRHQVRLDGGATPLADCSIYESKHGVIVDGRIVGSGFLPSQWVLLSRLLATLPDLGVATPAELVAAVRTGQLSAAFVSAQIQQHLRVNPPPSMLS